MPLSITHHKPCVIIANVFVYVSEHSLAFVEEADLEGEVKKKYHDRILYSYCQKAVYINL